MQVAANRGRQRIDRGLKLAGGGLAGAEQLPQLGIVGRLDDQKLLEMVFGVGIAAGFHFHVDDFAAEIVAIGFNTEHLLEHVGSGPGRVVIGQQQPVFGQGGVVARDELGVLLVALGGLRKVLFVASSPGLSRTKPLSGSGCRACTPTVVAERTTKTTRKPMRNR